MATGNEATRVLHYWRLLELVTASDIPELKVNDQLEVTELSTRRAPPWSASSQHARPTVGGGVWRYTVFGGLFDLAKAHRVLIDAFGDDGLPPEAHRRVTKERSALFSFALDENGELIPGSADLSMLAWVVAHAGSRFRPQVLDDFDGEQYSFVEQLDRLADPDAPSPTGAERPERPTWRDRATEQVVNAARDAADKGASTIGAAAGAAAGGAVPVAGALIGPIVATFVEKLLTLRRPERTNGAADHATPPTGSLLTVEMLTGLVEELTDKLGLRASLSPLGVRVRAKRVPADSEPSEQSWFLNSVYAAEMKQVSNAVRAGDVGRTLSAYLAVPGTEQRRRRLDVRREPGRVRQAVDPNRAPLGRWPAPSDRPLVLSQQFAVNTIHERLGTDAGVIGVNGPPGTGKTTMLRDLVADIVVERARRLATLQKPDDAFSTTEYRASFENGRWVPIHPPRHDLAGSEIVLATTTNSAAANVTAEIPSLDAVDLSEHGGFDHFTSIATELLGAPAWGLVAATLGKGTNNRTFTRSFWMGSGRMKETLNAAEGHRPTHTEWREAVSAFTAALATVNRLAGERQRAADALARLPDLRVRVTHERAAVEAAQRQAADVGGRLRVARARTEQARVEEENAHTAFVEHRRPTVLHWLWQGPARWREGRRRHEELHDRWMARRDENGRRQGECVRLDVALAEHREGIRRSQAALDAAARQERLDRQIVEEARERWGAAVPQGARDDAEQLCAPWADVELTRARTAVFFSAMALHRAFVLGAAKPVRQAVSVVVDLLNGTTVHLSAEARRAAWQTFFLLVPVVSTTFASLPRLFRGLGREVLGWLLVDEAGQATPQALAGGLWRTRRAVVVGDPRQLEPVLPVPGRLMAALAARAGLSREWTSVSSAQEVADRVTPVGTTLVDEHNDAGLWVGAPLRVHRRCDRPVFDAFSRMAYDDDLLIFGTSTDRPVFPGEDTWFHVPSEAGTEKWSRALGESLTELLRQLWRQGVTAETCILSPFRDVVTAAKELEASRRSRADKGLGEVGTVHTMQGKESDVVVLVLGTGVDSHGARSWATSRPNLFNVAVSRARRRLYVVGDVDRWGDLPYVRDLLPTLIVDRTVPRSPSAPAPL